MAPVETASRESIRDALLGNFLFSSLDQEEAEALVAAVEIATYATGNTIVREGDVADSLYLVVAGGVNVLKANGQFLAMLGVDGFFGEMGLFSEGATRTADCVAAMDTTCAVISKETLHHFCDNHPTTGLKIYRAIIRALAERLQMTSSDLAMMMAARVKTQADISDMVARARAAKAQSDEPREGDDQAARQEKK